MLFTRTFLDNGDQFDNQTVIPFYSVVDPTQPEIGPGEAGIQTAIKCANAMRHDVQEGSIFGLHLIEFKNADLMNVILVPFSTRQTIHVRGYNCGQDGGDDLTRGLNTSDGGGSTRCASTRISTCGLSA